MQVSGRFMGNFWNHRRSGVNNEKPCMGPRDGRQCSEVTVHLEVDVSLDEFIQTKSKASPKKHEYTEEKPLCSGSPKN